MYLSRYKSNLPTSSILIFYLILIFSKEVYAKKIYIEIERSSKGKYFQTAKKATDIDREIDFISHDSCKLGKPLDLWPESGENQRWLLEGNGNNNVYIKADTGCSENLERWISHAGTCESDFVDLWHSAGVNQEFELVDAPSIRDRGESGEFRYQDGKMVCLKAASKGKNATDCPRFISYGEDKQISLSTRCDENSAFRLLDENSPKTCEYRALSFNAEGNKVDLWKAFGENQTFSLHKLSDGLYRIAALLDEQESANNPYLSYSLDPDDTSLGLSYDAGENTVFSFALESGVLAPAKLANGYLIAYNRNDSSQRYVSATGDCGDGGLSLQSAHEADKLNIFTHERAKFRQGIAVNTLLKPITNEEGVAEYPHCPDPFIIDSGESYYLTCASYNGIKLYKTEELTNALGYEDVGWMVPEYFYGKNFGRSPEFTYPYNGTIDDENRHWANCQQRWASETIKLGDDDYMLMFSSPEAKRCAPIEAEHDQRYIYIGRHRIGVVFSQEGLAPNKFEYVSDFTIDLGNYHSGEIDPNVYQENGKFYLTWKQENNHCFDPATLNHQYGDEKDCGGSDGNEASRETAIMMQEITIDVENRVVSVVDGTRKALLRSGHNLWEDSWIANGSLIEGPEIIKHGGYYYLFYASGRFCTESYAQNVARSRNLYGPYETHSVPFLHSALLPKDANRGKKLLKGPGHAGFVQDRETGDWYTVFHASDDDLSCTTVSAVSQLNIHAERRRAYMGKLSWKNGWPKVQGKDFIH
ncbi:family 43 glycosylhydrolase [Grimontia sp. NTOU-MAR1]|uniref:family 43 glycosylhydrolase n=1 Tax=Grimontia sp. NTOU-MAR1 TaxID=3111011 RepID=UPI002DC03E0D|nr:family 43 glycosylhydrolase [Grimontia sp. NTOU-MAR1]WRV99841.1 family 43 glycosylhydrolase [Grimontia sp. NTOU-MAR1]